MYKNPLEIFIYKYVQQLVLSSEMAKILAFTHTPYIGITLIFIHELVVRARQLSLCSSVGYSTAPESQGRRFDSCQRVDSCIFCNCSWLGLRNV